MAATTFTAFSFLPVPSSRPRPCTARRDAHFRHGSPVIPSRHAFPAATTPLLRRRLPVVPRAGPPTSSTLLLVFLLPLSLLIGTVLVSIRVADDLDEKFFQELAMNEALREEAEEGEEEEGEKEEKEGALVKEEDVAAAAVASTAPGARNRPKREVERGD